jgi:dipeptidase E
LKFLLTSSGISNKSIQNALIDLLGKPIAESSALVIPTAAYYFSQGPSIAYRLISGNARSPLWRNARSSRASCPSRRY